MPKDTNSAFKHIFIGVLIPALILNKLSVRMGPLPALALALSFPLGLAAYEFLRHKKISPIVLLGLINTLVTGGLAVLGLGGLWFSFKEAFFPLIIGIFVYLSSRTSEPFIKTIFFNPQVMHVEKIFLALKEKETEAQFEKHLQFLTQLLSCSFFFSAILNFALSLWIFTPIDPHLDPVTRSVMLNQQISKMTTTSMLILTVPSMLFLIFIMMNLFKGIHKHTNLTQEDIIK